MIDKQKATSVIAWLLAIGFKIGGLTCMYIINWRIATCFTVYKVGNILLEIIREDDSKSQNLTNESNKLDTTQASYL